MFSLDLATGEAGLSAIDRYNVKSSRAGRMEHSRKVRRKSRYGSLNFQDKFDILLEKRISGVIG